jgi:hypothetical protein
MGLGLFEVSGRNLVPSPPAIIKTGGVIRIPLKSFMMSVGDKLSKRHSDMN